MTTPPNQFNAMWMKLGAQIADKINPRDFMYHDARQNKLVWMFMLEDGMTKADTQGYDIINFEGGVFASALVDSWEYIEYERVFKGIQAWLSRQEHLAPDESPDRHLLYHFAGPHSAKMKEYNYGKVRYYVPIKRIGRNDRDENARIDPPWAKRLEQGKPLYGLDRRPAQ